MRTGTFPPPTAQVLKIIRPLYNFKAGEDTLDPDQVRPYMEGWRDHILSALAQPDRPPYTPWPEDPERVWSLLRGATWWLPLSEPFLFRGPLPNENTAVLGTTAGLRIELEWLNRCTAQERGCQSQKNSPGRKDRGRLMKRKAGPPRKVAKQDFAGRRRNDEAV